MEQIYLTRRNLRTLLAKLDRVKAGGESKREIIKNDTHHPKVPCSTTASIIAVEDEDYYTDREPGPTRENV